MKSFNIFVEELKVKYKVMKLKKKEAFLRKINLYLNNEVNLINDLKKTLCSLSKSHSISEEKYLMLQCIHSGNLSTSLLENDIFLLSNLGNLKKKFSEVSKVKVLTLENDFDYTTAKKELYYLKKMLKTYDFDLEYQLVPLISFSSYYKIVIGFKFNENLCKQIIVKKLTNIF